MDSDPVILSALYIQVKKDYGLVPEIILIRSIDNSLYLCNLLLKELSGKLKHHVILFIKFGPVLVVLL